ncbi:hypothetical protein chiPu_0008892 [Chiloscyllium punctatum]|uniref:CRK SH3-binding GNRP n=1 Tax=Chiloscyllium punctatum TaxID=137246 RepID=A0A401SJ72_CHIPU|nr:hypothetical protein [Chiloscyllium punctatum]
MSGKLEKQDSQRSHLTSFTMKLMDKFHSPKIKRTPSKKGKPLEITIKANTEKPPNKTLNRLEEQEKEVVSALRYFKTIVDKMVIDKKVLEMLPGSASKVLEAILPLVQVDPRIQQSSAITSCLNQVYQSLANLIRWSDQVILKGVNLEDKERVMAMIKAVLDGIKLKVKFLKYWTADCNGWLSTNYVDLVLDSCSATELPLTDREKEILTKTTPMTRSLEIIPDSVDGECAPPKPPLPGIRIMDHSSVPPLPPKKRTSAPSPTRVAVVSPISRAASGSSLPNTKQDFDGLDCYLQRRLSGGSHSYSGESPRVSPCNSMGKLSKSDEQLSSLDNDSGQCSQNTSCETLVHAYMQFVEDYSEPQPHVFYQTPQNEHIYEQRNKRFQEVYGFNDSFSSTDSSLEILPPPVLPPKQRQLSESNSDDAGEGEYVNLYSSNHTNGDLSHPEAEIPMCADADSVGSLSEQEILHHNCPKSANENENQNQDRDDRRGETPNSPDLDQSDVADELSLIDHEEIVARLTLKQEGEDGPEVRGGSVDILIVHATETDRKDLVLYCEAFLTTYRTFIPPEEIIKKLHYRYEKFCHCPDTFKKRVSKNTFFLLVRVVDELCLVELSDDILKLLMELVFRLVCSGELSLARVLRKNILDKVDQKKTVKYASLMKPLAARGVAARPGTLHDFHSHEIAEQLTLLDAELFYKIEIPEVLLWAKEQNEEKSPNLTEFTEHFNNMSYWVRSIIIQQEKAQDRERLLLKFIKIMKHLRKLNNFNSYLAILSALDSAPIRRLEWQKQTSEGLAEYCTLIDSSSSFRAYRAALAEVEPPCIPYLGLILQDLTFVHLGNPDLIDGKINFSKRWQQFNILDSMRCFQQVHYELKRIDDIVIFFNDFSDHLAEEALWELSLKIKPRNIQRRKTDREEKT